MLRSIVATRTIIAAAIGGLFAAVMWFAISPQWPLNQYLGENDTLGLGWVYLNYPAFLIGMVSSGNYHTPAEWAVVLGTFIEWFVVAYVIGWLAQRAKGRTRDA